MKKFLAILLVLIMVLSVMPGIFAEGEAESQAVDLSGAENIEINLFDFGSLVIDKSTRSELAVGMGGDGASVFDDASADIAPTLGTNTTDTYPGFNNQVLGMWPVLDRDGYPTRLRSDASTNPEGASDLISLKYLFNKDLPSSVGKSTWSMLKANTTHSNYDVLRYPVNLGNLFNEDDGYLEFDSMHNYVWYEFEDGELHVEDYAARPESCSGTRYQAMGHFLPFNGPIAESNTNSYDAGKYPIYGSADYTIVKDGNTITTPAGGDNAANNARGVDSSNYHTTEANKLYALEMNADVAANKKVNMWIGMSVEFDFHQKRGGKIDGNNDMIFEFSGDDLMWVYINDVLVLDVANSGNHADYWTYDKTKQQIVKVSGGDAGGAKKGYINFATGEVIAYRVDSSEIDLEYDIDGNGTVTADERAKNEFNHVAYRTTLKDIYDAAVAGGYIEQDQVPEFNGNTFEDYERLSFNMFYMDTGHGTSNCNLKFNMDPLPKGNLLVEKQEANLTTDYLGMIESEYEFQVEIYKDGSSTADNVAEFQVVNNNNTAISQNFTNPNTPVSADNLMVSKTGEDGKFKLRYGQQAVFTDVQVNDLVKIKELPTGQYVASYTVNGVEDPKYATEGIKIENPESAYAVIFTNTYELLTESLTIKKTYDKKDENQSSLFRVEGIEYANINAPTVNMIVAITGDKDSVTINNLPVGTYKITELTDWTWRYTADSEEQTKEIVYRQTEIPVVKFTNTRTNTLWLSGDNHCENQFTVNTVEAVQE